MRSITFITSALLLVPQMAGAQQRMPSTIPPWTPFALNGPVAPDSTHARTAFPAPGEHRANAAPIAAPAKSTLYGAALGFVLGAGATWAVLHSGGSTAPCDRDANQDAMSAGECAGITIGGGVAGALVGALVARLL